MGNPPKSIKDFKKVQNTNPSNNPILQQKHKNAQSNETIASYSTTPVEENSLQDFNFGGSQEFRPQSQFEQSMEDFPKPNFISDENNYQDLARQTFSQIQQPTTMPQVSMQPQYAQVPFNQAQKPMQKSNIATRVAEAEAEIDALVGNTELFLGNIAKLKLDIVSARTMEELGAVMVSTHEVLQNIPNGFIDAETCRKIRICFSHLQKEKKKLLETEAGLLKLVSIGDALELEKAYMEVPASTSIDTIYEVKTFELNLLSRLPEIKEEMMRERVLSAYQQ